MDNKLDVFIYDKCFMVLNDVIGGRITGERQDTITVFYRGGDSVYFHIGPHALDVMRALVDRLKHSTFYGGEYEETYADSE